MFNFVNAGLAALLISILTGCMSTGKVANESKLAELVVGKSTQEEVTSKLGSPTSLQETTQMGRPVQAAVLRVQR